MRIEPLSPERAGEVAAVLARSHREDPACSYILPDPRRRLAVLRGIFRQWAADSVPFGRAQCALTGDRVVGAALWLPPSAFPPSLQRIVRGTRSYLLAAAIDLRGAAGMARYTLSAGRQHPSDPPHMYLTIVGVDDGMRGHGIGTRLIARTLGEADALSLACYAETSKGSNLNWYRRLGFDIEDDRLPLISGGPMHWMMWRSPQGLIESEVVARALNGSRVQLGVRGCA